MQHQHKELVNDLLHVCVLHMLSSVMQPYYYMDEWTINKNLISYNMEQYLSWQNARRLLWQEYYVLAISSFPIIDWLSPSYVFCHHPPLAYSV